MSDSRKLKLHVFVCTNKKEKGQSCAPKGAQKLRDDVKAFCQINEPSWHGQVRINQSGCLGRCEEGITAVIYPAGKWVTELKADDASVLIAECKKLMEQE